MAFWSLTNPSLPAASSEIGLQERFSLYFGIWLVVFISSRRGAWEQSWGGGVGAEVEKRVQHGENVHSSFCSARPPFCLSFG